MRRRVACTTASTAHGGRQANRFGDVEGAAGRETAAHAGVPFAQLLGRDAEAIGNGHQRVATMQRCWPGAAPLLLSGMTSSSPTSMGLAGVTSLYSATDSRRA
jgi:hypothetical protein